MNRLPRGVIPPLVTPFAGATFDQEAFIFNLRRYNETALAGYLALGSNGEGVLQSDDDMIRVLEVAAEERSQDKYLIAGTGRESTRGTIELTRRAQKAGAQAALVVPPCYFRGSMTDSALSYHYQAVADAAEIPILLYHVPKFSPVILSLRLILNLAQHPNIQGIKETSTDLTLFTGLLKDRPPSFRVYMGTANLFLAALVLGADGGILALANVAPRLCIALMQCVERGDLKSAGELQMRLLPVNQAITTHYGVPGLKHAMDCVGYRGGDSLRPLEPLSSKQAEDIEAVLKTASLSGADDE
jgi:4-hydroxy-2-oxoglutarate aldolase